MQKNDSYLKRLYQQVTHYWKKILKKNIPDYSETSWGKHYNQPLQINLTFPKKEGKILLSNTDMRRGCQGHTLLFCVHCFLPNL